MPFLLLSALVTSAAPEASVSIDTVALAPIVALPGDEGRVLDASALQETFELWHEALAATGVHVIPEPVSESSGSGDALSTARLAIEAGRSAMRELEAETAAQHFRSATEALERTLNQPGAVELLWQTYLDLASAFLAQEEPTLAGPSLAKAVRLRPGIDLDPRRQAPALIGQYNQVKTRVLVEPRAKLAIDTQPAGAQVLIDGVAAGRTPLEVEVLAGPHLVGAAALGFGSTSRVVTATAGAALRESLALTPTALVTAAQPLLREANGLSRPEEANTLARTLSRQVGADALLLLGAAPIAGGRVVTATLIGDATVSGVITFANPSGLPLAVAELVDRWRSVAPGAERGAHWLSAESPATPLAGVQLDFGASILGLPSQKQIEKRIADERQRTQMPVAAVEETSIWSSPWLWGGVAAVTAAGVVAAILLWPGEQIVHQPGGLSVGVEVQP